MNTQTILLIAILLNCLTVLLVLYLVYKGSKSLDEFQPYMKDAEAMRHAIVKRGNAVLEKTVSLAQDIIRNVVSSYQNNLKLSESFQDEMSKRMREGLDQNIALSKEMMQKASNGIIEAYQKQFSDMSKDIRQTGQFAYSQLMEVTKRKVEELAAGIEEQVASVRKVTEQRINDRLSSIEAEIKAYKEQRIKEIDSSIYEVLAEVAKKTLGKSIDPSEHEELVMKALKKAKEEKII